MNETGSDLRSAIQVARQQHRAGGGAVLDVLLRSSIGTEPGFADRLRVEAGVSVLSSASEYRPDFSAWTAGEASASRCVVLRSARDDSVVAAEDPWDEPLAQRVFRRVGRVLPLFAVERATTEAWLGKPAPGSTGVDHGADASGVTAVGGPIVAFVDGAICAAHDRGASDIHFECDRGGVTVKLRLDGVMSRFARLEGTDRSREVVSRIKVLAQLDITEQRLPQDGRFRFAQDGRAVDLRVSIMPSIHGEDAVLRLLDKAQLRTRQASIDLATLGFTAETAEQIRELAGRPNGMLLVTGPTGSGKTTTLYAVLSEINTGLEKIITIEDPVEYELPSVLQIPVNERKGLTFAKGLRSILRHDPDRILVGEIRDAETAEIAVQSALTGHLVFTTVHANSLPDIMGRFRHFGLDMFGFMSALNGVVVQRLVRRLCMQCRAEAPATPQERRWLDAHGQADLRSVPRATGCSDCHGTGYSGRFVIAEVHEVADTLRDAVTGGAPLSVIRNHAQERGVVSLAVQAARHLAAGMTTPEEIKRVVGWN